MKKLELTTGRVNGKMVAVLVLENRVGESTVLNMTTMRLATIKNSKKAKLPKVVAPAFHSDATTLPTD